MRNLLYACVIGFSLVATASCSRPQPSTAEALRPTATIKDIMDSIVDPSADVIWQSVETVVSAAGVEEHQPRTDEEWAEVRRNAVKLVEAPNLLIMDGRKVARMGEKSENPGIELQPEEIEALINKDRPTFLSLARALQDAAIPALNAIDAKNPDGLIDAGEKIDTACENCHLKYWYPGGGPPKAPPDARTLKPGN